MSKVELVKESKKTKKLAKKSGHGMQEIVVKKKSKSYNEHLDEMEAFFRINPDESMQAMLEPDWSGVKASDSGQKSLTKGFK